MHDQTRGHETTCVTPTAAVTTTVAPAGISIACSFFLSCASSAEGADANATQSTSAPDDTIPRTTAEEQTPPLPIPHKTAPRVTSDTGPILSAATISPNSSSSPFADSRASGFARRSGSHYRRHRSNGPNARKTRSSVTVKQLYPAAGGTARFGSSTHAWLGGRASSGANPLLQLHMRALPNRSW